MPYWVNEILRAFSLRLLLASKGLINQALMGIGIIDAPIDFLGTNVGLYVGLSYAYLLVMIFPLYNAIESLDKNQIEAARDLGAPWWRIHQDVVIPYAKPGIASGCTMVFMLSRRLAGGAAVPGRPEHPVVHLDRLRLLLPGLQLAARRRLCLHPAGRLHRLRDADAAGCSRCRSGRPSDELASLSCGG